MTSNKFIQYHFDIVLDSFFVWLRALHVYILWIKTFISYFDMGAGKYWTHIFAHYSIQFDWLMVKYI